MSRLINIIIDENRKDVINTEEAREKHKKFMELRALTIRANNLCRSIDPVPDNLDDATRFLRKEMNRVRKIKQKNSDVGTVNVRLERKVNVALGKMLKRIGMNISNGVFILQNEVSLKDKYVTIKSLTKEINASIKKAREVNRNENRSDRTQQQTVKDFTYTLVGNAHTKANQIIEVMEAKRMREVFEPKRPQTDDNHLGIELEFFCRANKPDLGLAFYRAGLSKYVHVHGDSSIGDFPAGYNPFEINILVKETEYKQVIAKVTEVLASVDAKVNKTCGMHVHIDARQRNKEILYANLVSAMPQLFQMNPKARREGVTGRTHYCKPNASRTFDGGMNRYHAINAAAYGEHGTIEVRLHSGTVDREKITNWCTILVAVANTQEDVQTSARSVSGFIKRFNIPVELREYIEARIAKFDSERAGQVVAEEAA